MKKVDKVFNFACGFIFVGCVISFLPILYYLVKGAIESFQ